MPKRSFRVGRSVTGLGLFATQPLERGEFIVAYRGQRITTAEAARREERGMRYMFEINSRWTIDGSSRRNLARYVNHACKPNAEAVLRKGAMLYVARRKIAPGDEITLDYGKEYFDYFIRQTGCRCATCMVRSDVRRSPRKPPRAKSKKRKARAGRQG